MHLDPLPRQVRQDIRSDADLQPLAIVKSRVYVLLDQIPELLWVVEEQVGPPDSGVLNALKDPPPRTVEALVLAEHACPWWTH